MSEDKKQSPKQSSDSEKIRDTAASLVFSQEAIDNQETAAFLRDLDDDKASAFAEKSAKVKADDGSNSSKKLESASEKLEKGTAGMSETPPNKLISSSLSGKKLARPLGALLLLALVVLIGYEFGYDMYRQLLSKKVELKKSHESSSENMTKVKLISAPPAALLKSADLPDNASVTANSTDTNTTSSVNATLQPAAPNYITTTEFSDFSKQVMESVSEFKDSISELKDAVASLNKKSTLLEERLSTVAGVQKSVQSLSLETKNISERLRLVETKLSNESRKLSEVYSKFREKKRRIRIIDDYTVEIDRVIYSIGDIVKIQGKELIIVSIDKKKGVYLKDSHGNKWLLKL